MEHFDFRAALLIASLAAAFTILAVGALFISKEHDYYEELMQCEEIVELPELNVDNMYHEIVKANIKHPDIVLAQAVLETGWFTSKVCNECNNCFGLMRKGEYFNFEHWTESVVAYRDKLQYKMFDGEDYFSFLRRIGYAEDEDYIAKVKRVRDTLHMNYPHLFEPH